MLDDFRSGEQFFREQFRLRDDSTAVAGHRLRGARRVAHPRHPLGIPQCQLRTFLAGTTKTGVARMAGRFSTMLSSEPSESNSRNNNDELWSPLQVLERPTGSGTALRNGYGSTTLLLSREYYLSFVLSASSFSSFCPLLFLFVVIVGSSSRPQRGDWSGLEIHEPRGFPVGDVGWFSPPEILEIQSELLAPRFLHFSYVSFFFFIS